MKSLAITVKKSVRRYKWNAYTNCLSNLLSSVYLFAFQHALPGNLQFKHSDLEVP